MAMKGKFGLVCGVVNNRSIGWAVAQSWRAAGCEVILTYQDERARSKVDRLVAAEWGDEAAAGLIRCDVRCDKEISALAAAVGARTEGRLDALLHAVAYAPPEALRGGSLLNTSRDAFSTTVDVSAYSLLALSRGLHPLLQAAASNTKGGDGKVHYGPSITTLSYIGARRAVSEYLVMGPAKAALEGLARGLAAELGPEGIRVNVISAGPVRTVAAKSIPGFSAMTRSVEEHSPLRRNISATDVAGLATFLASDAGSMITGQTIHVDAGHSAVWV